MVAKKKTSKKIKPHPHSHLHLTQVQVSAKKDLPLKKPFQKNFVMDEPLVESNPDDELDLDENIPIEAEPDISQPDADLLEDVLIEQRPEIVAELSEDPVRLYFREIGQIKLLNSDDEFRIATIIEAMRLVGTLRCHPVRKGVLPAMGIYHSLLTELLTSWKRFGQDAKRYQIESPDLCLMIAEAQALRRGPEVDAPSYIRSFLSNDRWRQDPVWATMV